MPRPLTRDELLALPVTTDLPTLGRAFGISEPVTRERHRRGDFEAMGIRVLRLGAKWRVITADIWQVLGIQRETDAAENARGAAPETWGTDGERH